MSYFEKNGHKRVRSSSLIPENDPTLLFTNAGMNQFKNVFLGKEKRDYKRATSVQKCVRAGGKHNDLENVGRTPRHHTFFEMLGNFSFGDYFKEEAIYFAWELITKVYGLDKNRLYATIYKDDDEAFHLWKKISGLPNERILRFGEKDNFWAMGDTGPCGPCSEILYDLGVSPLGHRDCTPDCECGRYLEIWNLVFMQYDKKENGEMLPLPSPSIDTGMGLERITSVLQGKFSNYDTDLFMPIIEEIEKIANVEYGGDEKSNVSVRIIADHSRAGAFLITDGVVPSNEGRGYVLRKILRRAIRHGKMLGIDKPFLYKISSFVAHMMGDVYPELIPSTEYLAGVIKSEEEKFSSTFDFGLKKVEEYLKKMDGKVFPGDKIFKLYDTYGFPVDILEDILKDKGISLDYDGFERELQKQRERARKSWKGEKQETVDRVYVELHSNLNTTFLGYDTFIVDNANVECILKNGAEVKKLTKGEEGEVILDRTPFYAESGGQVGDTGHIVGEDFSAKVFDTYSPIAGLNIHKVIVEEGEVSKGEVVKAEIDIERRKAIMRNHTATHLLHAALREVLGNHVKQSGSLVAPDRLRFDFSHFTKLSDREKELIEEAVNRVILDDIEVKTEIMDIDEAVESGAMALFGEKYQKKVRVVSVGNFSRELCGGTHLKKTGEMGIFKIISEGSVASGIRRIEAVTGFEAYKRFKLDEEILHEIEISHKIDREKLIDFINSQFVRLKELEKEKKNLLLKISTFSQEEIAKRAKEVNGVKVAYGRIDGADKNILKTVAENIKNKLGKAVVLLGGELEGKALLVLSVSDDLTEKFHAGKLIRDIAKEIDGGGGGRPNMAEAGGKSPEKLNKAFRKFEEILS